MTKEEDGASYVFFFFNDTATTEIYTLSLHDALPIFIHTLQLKQHNPLYTAGQIFNTATYFSDFLFMSFISPVESTQTYTRIHFLKIFVAASVAVSRRANSHLATMAE